MQLDIFEHSQQVMLRNSVIDAVRNRDASACQKAIVALSTAYASDPLLPEMEILCQYLFAPALPIPLNRSDAVMHLQEMEQRLEPAARKVFGVSADAWLAPSWLGLAQAIASLPFDAGSENLHAAPLFARGGHWQAAINAIETIPSWRRQPFPLSWMIDARSRLDAPDAIWHLIAELCWMAPQRACVSVAKLGDERLKKLLRRFETEFEDSSTDDGFSWFPAWLLIADGHLASGLKSAGQGCGTPAECCARLIMKLLDLERQGHHQEVVENRRRLRDTHASLFAMYMQTR